MGRKITSISVDETLYDRCRRLVGYGRRYSSFSELVGYALTNELTRLANEFEQTEGGKPTEYEQEQIDAMLKATLMRNFKYDEVKEARDLQAFYNGADYNSKEIDFDYWKAKWSARLGKDVTHDEFGERVGPWTGDSGFPKALSLTDGQSEGVPE